MTKTMNTAAVMKKLFLLQKQQPITHLLHQRWSYSQRVVCRKNSCRRQICYFIQRMKISLRISRGVMSEQSALIYQITGEKPIVFIYPKTEMSGGMSGCVKNTEGEVTKINTVSVRE